jgi:xanthine/CO dehydrogenase XdhC/CoxF family maturation factor
VKHWHETAAILERLSSLAQGERAALATVVRISGSAYRRPGAKFLVERDGRTTGGVSGGCLEADVRENALQLLDGGNPRLLHYETGSNEQTVWGLGLGCEGAVDVFVQRAETESFARARDLLSQGSPFGLAEPFVIETAIKGPHLGRVQIATRPARGESRVEERGPETLFVDVLEPPPSLLVFGAGDDSRPLASLAHEVGFQVTVVDHRSGFLTEERFPRPARLVHRRADEGVPQLTRQHFAVVETHSLQHDRDWMRALLGQPLAYLGLLGPRARKERLFQELGVPQHERVYAPVGLDLGAEGPEQVAISIVAEMLAVRAGREPLHLRTKRGGIHGSR